MRSVASERLARSRHGGNSGAHGAANRELIVRDGGTVRELDSGGSAPANARLTSHPHSHALRPQFLPLSSPFTTESVKLFPKFKEWGFETSRSRSRTQPHRSGQGESRAEKAGLAIGSVCACMGPGRDFRGSARGTEDGDGYVRALIDQAAALGCPRSSARSTPSSA